MRYRPACTLDFLLGFILLSLMLMTEGMDVSAGEPAQATPNSWEPLYTAEGFHLPETDWEERVIDDHVHAVREPMMRFYRIAGEKPRPVVLICPGGGYQVLAIEKEGHAVARWFNERGIHACVLKYRLKEYGWPAPLQDVLRALRILRSQAAERGIDAERVGVLGFSAGGHVAGMATTLWDAPEGRVGDALDAVSARPDFSMLIYPVVSMQAPYGHTGSRHNLLGNPPDPALCERLSLDTQVSPRTPPVFLVHTAEDASVPVQQSLILARALADTGVPVDLHVYARGPHGFGMLPGHGPASSWPDRLADRLQAMGWTDQTPK